MSEVDELLVQFRRAKAQKAELDQEQAEEQTETPEPNRKRSRTRTRTRTRTPEPTITPSDDPELDRLNGLKPWSTVPTWMFSAMKTRLYAAGHSQVFHADRSCRELDGADNVRVVPIRFVVTRRKNPQRPCHRCTMGMDNTIRVALDYDGVDPDAVVYPSNVAERRQRDAGGPTDETSGDDGDA